MSAAIQMSEYEAKQAAKDASIKAMQAARPNLVPGYGVVVAAKNIRIELKAAFPGVKFSVKSEKYSGGNSININYIDGPKSDDVENVVKKYAKGRFNGMEDIYDYKEDNLWGEAFGSSYYIFVRREYSDSMVEKAIEVVKAQYPNDSIPSLEDFRNGRARIYPKDGGNYDFQQWIWMALNQM